MRHNTFKLALAIVACLSVFSFAQAPAIPILKITTQNNQEPGGGTQSCGIWGCGGFGGTTTNYNYVKINSIELTGARGNFNFSLSNRADSIRVRGNSTAQADKKPYRIKFADKKSMFGREAHKSWVLLANYYDGTFALNAIAFKLAHKMGLDFTPNSEFVEVQLNGQSKGFYQLTEQIQVNSGRVDIREQKDWFAEFDYHDADKDEVKFTTSKLNLPTFIKSPEIESGSYNVNNPTIKFAVDEINALTNKMSESGFPTNGYRDLMDLDTWAKYVLIQQFMDNFDFNSKAQDGAPPGSNFCYRDSTGKVKAGPIWDLDLAAGVTSGQGGFGGIGGAGSFPAHYQTYQEPLRPKHVFYQRLWEDKVFLAKFQKAWNAHRSDISAIPTFIDSIAGVFNNKIGSSNKWANNQMMGSATLTQQQFNTEISNLKTWWNNRLNWFGQQLTNMNINVNDDIATTNTVTVTFDANGGTPAQATQTVIVGQKATKPANPTRSGCTFDDWYKDGGSSTGTFTDKWDFNTAVTGKMTLYAKWSGNNCGGNNPPPTPSNSFTVTFNTLSGSAQPVPQAQTVTSGAKATEPATMTRQGTWTFIGWYKDNGVWQERWDFTTDVVTEDIILYAYWKSTTSFTVTFNSNSGSSVANQTVLEGEKATQPADPTREGFVFSGWYKDVNLNTPWNFDSDIIGANTTIYAKWSTAGAATYTVTFNSNGGTSIPAQTVNQGGKVSQPANPVRSGYVFDGWYRNSGLTTLWNFDTDVVNSPTTIYAKWTGSRTVTFVTNGGSNIASQTVPQGGKITKPNNPTRSGYAFVNWYKEQALTTLWNFETDVVNANISIYAKWEEVTSFTVSFNTNGGSIIISQPANDGAKAIKPPNPVREGYTFDGWYKEADLTTAWNFDTDIVRANITLNAKWTSTSFAMVRPQLFKSLTAIKNGFIINSGNNVSMTVFNLNGNVVRKAAFASGNHTVKLEDLPKGMYIVKASFGNGTTPVILRLPIR